MVELARAAWPAVMLLATPFLLSTLAALMCAAVHLALKRGPQLEEPAGPWLERRSMGTRVGVSPEILGSMDGFWPDSNFIGLSPRTWVDQTAAGRAVAAHELGHALTWRTRPVLARRLAVGRQILPKATAVAGAGVLIGALLDAPGALGIAALALLVAVGAHVAVLWDEGLASLQGHRVLRGIDPDLAQRAALAMACAFLVYLAPLAVHGVALLGFAWLAQAALIPSLPAPDSVVGLWAILLLFPFLLLRAAQVLSEAARPTPVKTEFRLNWTQFQERTWEFHSGVVVLLWLALTYNQPVSEGLAALYLVGVLPAMGPLGGLGRLVVVLPIAFAMGALGMLKDPPRSRIRTPRPQDPLEMLTDDPSLKARAAGLFRMAWVPLLAVLVTRALSSW